jgi:hypothetical protein
MALSRDEILEEIDTTTGIDDQTGGASLAPGADHGIGISVRCAARRDRKRNLIVWAQEPVPQIEPRSSHHLMRPKRLL